MSWQTARHREDQVVETDARNGLRAYGRCSGWCHANGHRVSSSSAGSWEGRWGAWSLGVGCRRLPAIGNCGSWSGNRSVGLASPRGRVRVPELHLFASSVALCAMLKVKPRPARGRRAGRGSWVSPGCSSPRRQRQTSRPSRRSGRMRDCHPFESPPSGVIGFCVVLCRSCLTVVLRFLRRTTVTPLSRQRTSGTLRDR